MKIILASASPRRKMLLEQIGINPQVIPSSIDEKITKTKPEEVVIELSSAKAEDIACQCKERMGEGIVIGADTVVAAEGRILGKPENEETAAEMIRILSGKSHQVYTGVTLIHIKGGEVKKRRSFAEETEVFVYPMNEEEIAAYVKSGEPMDKAGAYGIQGAFAAFIQGIKGDYSNVVGLPVGRTYQEMKNLCNSSGRREKAGKNRR